MSIEVRYFARLREQLNKSEDQLEPHQAKTVLDVWQQSNPNIELPDNTLSAVNMEYVSLDTIVADKDEVAFFPPVTGG